MTSLRTVTYDTETHKILSIEPTDEIINPASRIQTWSGHEGTISIGCDTAIKVYKTVINAAPEFVSLSQQVSTQASAGTVQQAQPDQHELHAASVDVQSGGDNLMPQHRTVAELDGGDHHGG